MQLTVSTSLDNILLFPSEMWCTLVLVGGNSCSTLCGKELIPFKMNYVLEINYLPQACCLRRVYSLYLRGLTRCSGFCKIRRDLNLWRNYKFSSFLEVWVSLIHVYILLHLIRDRPWNDLGGCVHAESTAETNPFVECNSGTWPTTLLWNAGAQDLQRAGEVMGRVCSSLLVQALLAAFQGWQKGWSCLCQ